MHPSISHRFKQGKYRSTCGFTAKFYLFCFLLLCLSGALPAGATPYAYTAKYDVGNDYITAGEAVMTLTPTGQHWSHKLDSYTVGVTALVYKKRLTETSTLFVSGEQLLPLTYVLTEGNHKNKHITTTFDYENKQLHIQKGTEEPINTAFTPPVFDCFSVILEINRLLQKGFDEVTLSLVDKTKLKQMPFKTLGVEKVSTPLGTFDTIKVQRHQGSRTTYSWHAKALGFQPVLVEQYRKDALEARMTLKFFQKH
ncbi:MAG TPA: hypothetical protein DCZ12_00915 [Gammaproteobacteria bacterium]|nr:hypothetical protein [Gammaproteobacteria bacterium]